MSKAVGMGVFCDIGHKHTKMVKRGPASKRKGMNGLPPEPSWLKKRNAKKLAPPPARIHPETAALGRKADLRKFLSSLTPQDIIETQAVKEAQRKIKNKCIHPCGWQQLRNSLSPKDKKRKPTTSRAKCIAIPPGTPVGASVLATWQPCWFIAEYFPNGATHSLAILERPEVQLSVDKKRKAIFVVLMSDCFLIPESFSADFDMNFAPNSGVYVIETKLKDTYVGFSENITLRVKYHNAGKGATFTSGKKWFRISTIAPPVAPGGGSQENAETVAWTEVRGALKVRGAARCQKVIK